MLDTWKTVTMDMYSRSYESPPQTGQSPEQSDMCLVLLLDMYRLQLPEWWDTGDRDRRDQGCDRNASERGFGVSVHSTRHGAAN